MIQILAITVELLLFGTLTFRMGRSYGRREEEKIARSYIDNLRIDALDAEIKAAQKALEAFKLPTKPTEPS